MNDINSYVTITIMLPNGARIAIVGRHEVVGDVAASVIESVTMPEIEAELLFDPDEDDAEDGSISAMVDKYMVK